MILENVTIHNSIPDIGYFAKVCYDKLNKKYTISSLIKFTRDVLYKNRHMSVFEHIWIQGDTSRDEYFKLIDTLIKSNNEQYINLFYIVDIGNGKIRIFTTLRTLLELYELGIENQLIYELLISVPYIEVLINNEEPDNDDIYQFKYINSTIVDLDIYSTNVEQRKHPKVYLVSTTGNKHKFDTYTFLLEDIPLFVRDQIVRHRFGVFTIKSYRYTVPDKYYMFNGNCTKIIKDSIEYSLFVYNFCRKTQSVKREKLRIVLPVSITTKVFWTLPKISLENFLKLRLDVHAQEETRKVAQAIQTINKLISS